MHNEPISVVAVCVSNPDRSRGGINRCDAAPSPTGFGVKIDLVMLSKLMNLCVRPLAAEDFDDDDS